MRVLEREAFLQLPPGTFYCKGNRYGLNFGSLLVKEDTLGNDWVCLDPCQIGASDPDQLEGRLREMLTNEASYPLCGHFASARDAMFEEEEAIFLVFEHADLVRFRTLIDRGIAAG